jgi:hypothetical protein
VDPFRKQAGGWHVRTMPVLPEGRGDYALGSPKLRAAAWAVIGRACAGGEPMIRTVNDSSRTRSDGKWHFC